MSNASPNIHIKQYLDYYLDLLHSPKFAVMLNGPWGVGKTYFLKDYLSNRYPEKKEYVYISLFGLQSAEQIDEALFQAIYFNSQGLLAKGANKAEGFFSKHNPLSKSKTAEHVIGQFDKNAVMGKIGQALLKHLKIEKSDLLDCWNKFTAKVYVFDDLERAKISTEEVFGYLNQFVEHEDCKVIVVANEGQIDDEGYCSKKEKVIGKTLLVHSDYENALTSFVEQGADDPASKFLANGRDKITAVYKESGIENLRILQQSLWDFERLYKIVDEKQQENEPAMVHLLCFFLALSF